MKRVEILLPQWYKKSPVQGKLQKASTFGWERVNPFPHIDAFWCLCSGRLLENIVTKEEIAQNEIFYFFDKIYMFKDVCCRIVVWGKGLTLSHTQKHFDTSADDVLNPLWTKENCSELLWSIFLKFYILTHLQQTSFDHILKKRTKLLKMIYSFVFLNVLSTLYHNCNFSDFTFSLTSFQMYFIIYNWKHCSKRRNFSWWIIPDFSTTFLTI